MQEGSELKNSPMLASIMIHEFKNPISLIHAEVSYLELVDTEKKFNKHFKVLYREIDKATGMVNEWLNSVDSPYVLNDIIRVYDTIVLCRDYFLPVANKSIKMTIHCKDQSIQILGNQKLFGIAISNTIKNAIEAIKREGTIQVTAKRENDKVMIMIEDDGVGIPEEVIEKILGEAKYSTKMFGTGLGVNVARMYAVDNGGSYKIENRKGGGCIVSMSFPVIEE